MNSFRILSLDGGGIRGAFSAAVLAALEKDTGKLCADHFDLIVGTSTGGILALGLGLGMPAAEIVEFYKKHGPTIFPSTGLAARFGKIRQFFRPKHSHQTLRTALLEAFGKKKFGESKCRLVITTYDAIRGRIFLLKTAHHPEFKHDYQADAVDVALATSAAPTYFSAAPFPIFPGSSFVDGGVWANTPSLVGVVEAVHFLKVPLEQIDMLSVGTTAPPFNIADRANSGITQWNAGLLDLMFNGQMEAARSQTGLLLNGRLHRIDVVTKAGDFSLDSASPEAIGRLINLGDGEARRREHLVAVRTRFLRDPLAPAFRPLNYLAVSN